MTRSARLWSQVSPVYLLQATTAFSFVLKTQKQCGPKLDVCDFPLGLHDHKMHTLCTKQHKYSTAQDVSGLQGVAAM